MQMTMVTDIQIDLYGEMQYYMASAKQGDRDTRYIRVQLMNNGNEFQIPDDVQLIANIQKPDGKFCYNECTKENNRVMVQLTNQALAAAGTAYCDIEMRSASGELILSSAAFTIEIERSMRNENAILSSNEMTFLDRKVQKYIDRMLATEKQVLDTEAVVKVAEAARELAEGERKAEERTRNENEQERIRAENERKRQETARQQQETTRQQQEQKRQTDTAQAVQNAQEATRRTEEATEKCTDATGRAEEALKNEQQLEEAVDAAQEIKDAVERMYASVIPVEKGGTGSTAKHAARKALGITPYVVVGRDAADANGFYKAFSVTMSAWKTYAVLALIEPWNEINLPFRPLIVYLILKSNSTGKYAPAAYLQSIMVSGGGTLDNTREVLDNLYLAQLNTTPAGEVELWFKQTKSQGPVRITVLSCAGRGITANDGLDSAKINGAGQTASAGITKALSNVYSLMSVLASNQASPACEGMMSAEDKVKLDGLTNLGQVQESIRTSVATASWANANKGINVIIDSIAAGGGWVALAKLKSQNGVFHLGVWKDAWYLNYTENSVAEGTTNGCTKQARLLDEAGNASFPGTVQAASFTGKLTNARKIELKGDITGNVQFDGSRDVAINVVRRSCVCGHTAASDNAAHWYKAANITIPAAGGHRSITFLVKRVNDDQADNIGILNIGFKRSNAAADLTTDVFWSHMAGTSFDPNKFLLAFNPVAADMAVEFWVNITGTNECLSFTVLTESSSWNNVATNVWTLNNVKNAAGSTAPTAGYTQRKSYFASQVMPRVTLWDGVHLRDAMWVLDDGDGAANNGSELMIQGNGNLFIGGGESPNSLHNALKAGVGTGEAYSAGAERTYISADADLFLYSGCQTIANRKGVCLDGSGNFRPLTNKGENLGHSSYYWNNAYISRVIGTADKWTTGRKINGLTVDGSADRTNYCGVCETAAATAAKTAACAGFALVNGAEVFVKFKYKNTAANPTLNVNGTGAKPIYCRNAAVSAGTLDVNTMFHLIYNGTQYELVGGAPAGGAHIGTAAPDDTGSLWVDTGNGGILKYYNTASKKWAAAQAVWG